MKKLLVLFIIAGTFSLAPAVLNAEADHDHDHKHIGGPKGGRLLENTDPRAEFYVEKDNTVTIAFYDDALKPVSVADQNVIVIAEAEGNKTQLDFEKKGEVLVSKGGLPDNDGMKLVVRFKQNADAKPLNFRFSLEKGICGECKRAEYACICAH